jgi:hypothetical protein
MPEAATEVLEPVTTESTVETTPEPAKAPPAKKASQSPPPSTPNPPYKTFYTAHPNPKQWPQQLINWWTELPTWASDRMIAYVYRDFPVLKVFSYEQKKAGKEAGLDVDDNYIDKLAKPPQSTVDFFDRYGSGDYHFVLSDVTHEKRILATCHIRENWRDFRKHPPTDRRIDKTENVDMDEKGNAGYIAYLRSEGKLPNQMKEQTSMAEATAVSTVTGLLGQVVGRVMDDKKTDSDAGKGMATVIGEVMGVMKENMPKQESPLDNVDKMVGILDRLRPAKPEGNGENGLLSIVIASISENSKQMLAAQAENAKLLMQMQSERISDMRAIIESLKPSANPNLVTGTPVAPAESAKEYVKELLEMASVLGLRRGGAAAAEATTGAFDWKAQLPEILDSGGKILGTIVRAWEIKSMLDARAANPNAPIIVQAPQPQLQPQAQSVPATSEPVTENGAEGEGPDQFMLQMLVQGFLNHFKNGWGGDTFAEWLIAGTDQATYENLKSQGPQALTLMLNQIPVTVQEIAGKEALLTQFIDEFMRAAEIRAAQDAEDEEGEGEGEGEPPEEIPVPAVNGPAKIVRTVKPKAVG